jgi:hypothetical protein
MPLYSAAVICTYLETTMPAMRGCGFITRDTLCGPSCTFNAAPTPCPVPVIRYIRYVWYVVVMMRSSDKECGDEE